MLASRTLDRLQTGLGGCRGEGGIDAWWLAFALTAHTASYFLEFPCQGRIMRPVGLQRFPYKLFKGVNFRDAPLELDPAEAQMALNVQPINRVDLSGLKQRGGQKALIDNANAPTSPWQNALFWAKQGIYLMSHGAQVYWWRPGDASINPAIFTGSQGPFIFTVFKPLGGVETAWIMPVGAGVAAQKWTSGSSTAWLNSPPAPAVCMTNWRGRIIIANFQGGLENRLRFSDVGNPESPASSYGNNFIDFLDDSVGIQNLVVLNDRLYVFKPNGVYEVYDANTFANRLVCRPGTPGPNMAVGHSPTGRLYWWSSDGHIYSSDTAPGNVVQETNKIGVGIGLGNGYLGPNNPFWGGAGTLYGPSGRLISVPWLNTLYFFYGTSFTSAAKDRCLELIPGQPGNPALFFHTCSTMDATIGGVLPNVGPGGLTTPNPLGIVASAAPGGANIGRTYQLFSGLDDDGVAIPSMWESSNRPFISEEPLERVRRVNARYSGVFKYEQFDSMDPIQFSQNPQPSPNFTDTFPESSVRNFEKVRPEGRGRYHAFRLSNSTLGKTFAVDDLEFVFRGGKEH